ncbi:MAG: hypothetical protein ACUVX8_03010 [Candidatus Zipacnadales bacterium]
MTHQHVRVVALGTLLTLLPVISGCGGGLVELSLTAPRLYGAWKLYKLFTDGRPSWIEAAEAIWKFKRGGDYELTYLDGSSAVIARERGIWEIQNGVLVLQVRASSIYPENVGKEVRLPGHFEGAAANRLFLTRRVTEGQVVVSQEERYERVTQ